MENIEWIKKIAENQQFRSTWEARVDNVECIVKKISSDSQERLLSLAKDLKRQIRFSEILNKEEQRSICLFDTMIEDTNFIAFVRKKIEGIPLDQLLAKQRFSVAEAISLIIKISHIVQIAHAHNVSHGDLKPSNIIITESKEAVIIDWDTMSINESVENIIGEGNEVTIEQSVGTPQYMAVEQFQGHKIDALCDVYSLGIILYQILTGSTPFDENGPKTFTQMAIYKQTHELKSILVKYPDMNIPSDLAKMVEDSLKNDRNQRIQNIDIFINRLQTIGKISTSQAITATTLSNQTETYVASKSKGKEHKLVLIGHTGSGKTVLAAGLYATQDKDFAVDAPGSTTQTGIHAINTKTIIEEGHWPAATSVGDITQLQFKINYKGKEEFISFDEYAGERLEMENYDKLIIKHPDGAFILLNPGGEQWHDIRSKNSLLSDMKHYINLLSQQKNKPPIALVITASDRLESDLKDFASTFQQHVNELKNLLEVKKCSYNVFYISVSGILEDQNKPNLNPQHIKDPFIWLLNKFTTKSRKTQVQKIFKTALIIIIAFLLIGVANWGREYYQISMVKSSFVEAQKEYFKNTKSDDYLIDYRKILVDLRNELCSSNHISITFRNQNCTSSCLPVLFYPYYKIKMQQHIWDIENEIDNVNNQFFTRQLDDALANANEDNRKVQQWIDSWMPLHKENLEIKNRLRQKCLNEMPSAIERFDIKELRNEFVKLINTPKDEFPFSLNKRYENWQKVDTVLSNNERNSFGKELLELFLQSKKAVENKHFEVLCAYLSAINKETPKDLKGKLEKWDKHQTSFSSTEREAKDKEILQLKIAANKRVFYYQIEILENNIDSFESGVDELASLIKNLAKFKESTFQDIQEYEFDAECQKLEEKIYTNINVELKRLHNKYHKEQMEKDIFTNATYYEDVKNKVLVLLPYNKESEFSIQLERDLANTKQIWHKKQEKKVDDFISQIQYKSLLETLDDLKGFCFENSNNQYLRKAEEQVFNKIKNEIDGKLKNFDYKEESYRNLKELCAKISSTRSSFIQNTQYYKFANLYYNWMATNPSHTITISKIEASTTYNEGAYIYNSDYYVAAWDDKKLGERQPVISKNETLFYSSWFTIKGYFSVECKPWEYMFLNFQPHQNIEWGIDKKLAYQNLCIFTGENLNAVYFDKKYVIKTGDYAQIDFSNISLRIYFDISGKTIWNILEEARK